MWRIRLPDTTLHALLACCCCIVRMGPAADL
jgi:hypothetical protein